MVSILSRLAPRLLVASDLDTQAISRDPAVVKAYIDDPLVSQKVSTRWYGEIMKSMKKAHKGAASLRIPMLLMQSGADRLVDPGGVGCLGRALPRNVKRTGERQGTRQTAQVAGYPLAWKGASCRLIQD